MPMNYVVEIGSIQIECSDISGLSKSNHITLKSGLVTGPSLNASGD